jgi:predicted exporter
MPTTQEEFAVLHAAYRKALFKIISHGVFFTLCCAVAVIARRMMKMPPSLLTVVFAVALILFGGDLVSFFRHRRRLQRWLEAQHS